MESIGDRVKALREELGLSQKEFGAKLHISNGHVSNVERGSGTLSKRTVSILCKEFNVREEWLYTGEGLMFNYLRVAQQKLHETFDDKHSRYADTAVKIASWRSDMLQKVANNIFAAYYDISQSPLIQEDECHLANEMVTYILFAWASANDYERIKLEGKFELIFPNFRQIIRQQRERLIKENAELGRTLPSQVTTYALPQQTSENTVHQVLSIPVVGRAAAGLPIEMIEELDGSLAIDDSHIRSGDFAVVADGDSMIDAGIHSGDRVVIRPQPTVENGEIALVAIADGSTIKHFYRTDDGFALVPGNSQYETQFYPFDADVRVIGRVIKVINK